MVIDRRTLLLGGVSSLLLSACSGAGSAFAPTSGGVTAAPNSLSLYDQMRAAGVYSFVGTDGRVTTLPEYASKIAPFDSCGPAKLARPRSATTFDNCTNNNNLPVIATVTCYAGATVTFGAVSGDFYDFRGGYESGLFGGPFTGPIYTSKPPGLQNRALNCVGESFTAIGTALVSIASNIKNAQNAITLYGPNVVRAAGWLITGTITASEFATLFITFCGPAELVALLGAAAVTAGAVIEYIKCLHGG